MRWSLASVLALIMVLAAATAARAEVVDDNPAASSRGAGQVTVFIRGPGGDLQYSELAGGAFTPWTSLGGVLTSGPGTDARDAGTTTDVFVRGGDNAMWQRLWHSGAWSNWFGLGGGLLSAPAVDVRQGGGYVDTYYRGADNGVVARSWVPGQGWGAEDTTTLGGKTLSAPALVSRAPEVLDVFARGTDDRLYRIWWNGSAWSGWSVVPGGMTTTHAPAVTTRATGTMDLFVRTPSGGAAWASFDGAVWSAWKTVPGQVDSGLAAVSDHPDRIYLFARRGADVVWNVYDRGLGPQDGWRGWQSMHPAPPPPGCDPNAGRLTAHARTVRFGRRPVVTGRARRVDGAPLASSAVTVTSGTGSWARMGVAAASGIYKVRVPKGPNRTLRVQAQAPGASSLICTTGTVKTSAGVKLTATRRVRPRGRVRFRGRLLGRPVPRSGKLVEIQAFDGGRWRVFASPRARGKKAKFRTSYRLRHTFGPRTFRFRARVRHEAGYPYELGYSRRVKVRVR